jgi:hypothetical protein
MKTLLLLALFVARLAGAEVFQVELPPSAIAPANYPPASPQYYAAAPIEIPAGATLEVMGVYGSSGVIAAYVKIGATEVLGQLSSAQQKATNYGYSTTIIGPATVRFARDGNQPQIACYRFTTGEESAKSDAVVIPDDNSGNHRVILEASTDMRIWEEVQPGSYPTTTPSRFFRVRVQKE